MSDILETLELFRGMEMGLKRAFGFYIWATGIVDENGDGE